MVVPGPVGNLEITAGDASLMVTFTAPTTGGPGPYMYGYKLRVNNSPFLPPAILWSVTPTSNSVISIPISSSINNGDSYSIIIIPSNIDGAGTEVESATVVPSAAITLFAFSEPVNSTATIIADVTEASIQSGDNTVTLDWLFSAAASTSDYLITPPDQSNVTAGYVDTTSSANIGVADIANSIADSTNATIADIVSLSATKTTGSGDVEQTAGFTVEYTKTFTDSQPQLASAGSIELTAYRIDNGVAVKQTSAFAVYDQILNQILATLSGLRFQSIYIFTYTTTSGTTITIPVENNQAYNDYLHDESGYQNRRENRLLTSGFYRGPVDSSTLTRIRSANGVLLGVNGVPGGMQGSRCCR